MHELSLCGAIVDTVSEHAEGRPVTRVRLQVGHFRQVVPETLQFCWEARVAGTALQGCVLDVEHVPATVECSGCGATTTLAHPVLRCGRCESTAVTLITGEEFLIESIDVGSPTEGSI